MLYDSILMLIVMENLSRSGIHDIETSMSHRNVYMTHMTVKSLNKGRSIEC